MNEEEIRKIIEEPYDDLKEDSLRSMVKEFHSRKMRSIAVLMWSLFFIFAALAVFCGIQFFRTDQTRCQILYAAGFICCIQIYTLLELYSWQMIHRNSIKREIRRLELRIAELTETVKEK